MDSATATAHPRAVMRTVRQRIDRGGERLWRLDDFAGLPFMAVAQALSRLKRQGVIERLSKGVYFRTRATAFGKSKPNPAEIQKLPSRRSSIFPSGIAAANVLGFSTQIARAPSADITTHFWRSMPPIRLSRHCPRISTFVG